MGPVIINRWGYFQGEGQEKILLCKGGHYMKNKNIGGGGVLSTQPDQQKRPSAKMRKKCKKLSNIEKIFLARFAHSTFYKIHISGAANRNASVQHAKDVFSFFFFFFLLFVVVVVVVFFF